MMVTALVMVLGLSKEMQDVPGADCGTRSYSYIFTLHSVYALRFRNVLNAAEDMI